jgi:hypothetical protein
MDLWISTFLSSLPNSNSTSGRSYFEKLFTNALIDMNMAKQQCRSTRGVQYNQVASMQNQCYQDTAPTQDRI